MNNLGKGQGSTAVPEDLAGPKLPFQPTDGTRLRSRIWLMSPRAIAVMVVGLVALQLVHIFGRGTLWIIDPRWASGQYLFSLILFGPFLAGITAYQGRKAAEVHWLLRSAPLRATLIWLRSPLVMGLSVFLAGWIAVVTASVASGAPWNLTLLTARNLGSGILGVTAFAAFGFAMGAMWKHKLVPAVAVVITFAGQIWAWTGAAPALVWFGGGSAGATGGDLDPVATALRVAFSLAIIWLSVTVARKSLGGTSMDWPLWLGGAGGLAIVLLAPGIEPFKASPITWQCAGEEPQACVPAQHTRFLPEISGWVASSPAVGALVTASDHVAETLIFDDDLLFAQIQKHQIDSELVKERLSGAAMRMTYPNCFPNEHPKEMSPSVSEASLNISSWMDYAIMGPDLLFERYGIDDPSRSLGIPTGPFDSPEVQHFLRDNLESMPSCRQ